MNAGMDAGMEIKQVGEGFENQYVEEVPEQPQVTSVCLKRTPQGLIRDDVNGKEISSVFEIIEVGDYINHQEVIEVTDKQIVLKYFNNKNILRNENDIFSVLLKEEVADWKRSIKEVDFTKIFEDIEAVELFRAMELTCINVNMELVNNLYVAHSDKLNERIMAIISSTLRKSFVDTQDNLNEANVISFSINYNPDEVAKAKEDIESRNGKFMYHISLFNPDNCAVNDGDIIIC